jgi:hypothetical protein
VAFVAGAAGWALAAAGPETLLAGAAGLLAGEAILLGGLAVAKRPLLVDTYALVARGVRSSLGRRREPSETAIS